MRAVTVSSRKSQPQKIPKKGMRKVTEVATVAPERWMRRKKKMNASAVQMSASAMPLSQLRVEGMLSGNESMAQGMSTSPAPSKLPEEATSGLTPWSLLFIQLAPKP